jgi:prevent-host-death family protein
MQSWQMEEAKARMSELVKRAQLDGPQEITMHGKCVAVILSRETFDRLCHRDESLAAFMQRSPLRGLNELELERDPGVSRDVSL